MTSKPITDDDRQRTLASTYVIPVDKILDARQWLKEKMSKDKLLLYHLDRIFNYIDQALNIRR